MNTTITAQELTRHSRVIRTRGEMPYLVDSVTDEADGTITVRYSSGDVDTMNPTQGVTVRD